MTPIHLRCEYRENPLGIDAPQPRLSWILRAEEGAKRGQGQTAYQILAASSAGLLAQDEGDLWDSGKTASAQSVHVEYAGKPLPSLFLCHWKIRVWDQDDHSTTWSDAATWRMGILHSGEWAAQWIWCPTNDTESSSHICPWFRKRFRLEQVPDCAIACVSSIGYHELYVNGRKVSDYVLTPSVSDLRKRARYLTHDITSYLTVGQNAVAIWLAPGWSDAYGDETPPQLERRPLCFAQLHLGADVSPVVTDASWRCTPSPTSHLGRWHNGDFGGDRVDAGQEIPDWNRADFDDSNWRDAVTVPSSWMLSPDLIEPNRLGEKIAATEMTQVGPGRYRFVMNRLFAGWVEVKIRGRAGTTVVINVSSLADRDVEMNQRNEYVIGGDGAGVFRNRFSYHELGFVTLEGLETVPALTDVVGYQVTNDRERVGGFDCSNPLIGQIYEVTAYTYENLSTGGMTVDCPHRERLGYGGDGHVSLEMAVDTFASGSFLSKWGQDWCDVQDEDGRIPHTAPTLGGGGGPAWSGLVIVLPWEVYLSYGDRRILENAYPFAQKWLVYLARHVGEKGLLEPFPAGKSAHTKAPEWLFLGDWVAPGPVTGNFGGRHEWSNSAEALLFNNCYYRHVLSLAARMADILGHPKDARAFRAEAAGLKTAIHRHFFDPSTQVYLDARQTHCIMPLLAEVVPDEHIKSVEANLEREIRVAHTGHLDTGMHGTYFMTKYLVEHDRSDLVFTYASQTTYPSYGELLSRGYETWPELWEGADSRLHGCLNGIGGWFQRGLAGIRFDPAEPGYKRIIIKPAMVGDLAWVECHHDSPYGRIVSNWKRENGTWTMEVRIPANTTAIIHVPGGDIDALVESGRPVTKAEGVRFLGENEVAMLFEVGSGNYLFSGPGGT